MASPQPPPQTGSEASQRTRLLLAGGITAVLAILVVAVLLLTGSDEERTFDPAPMACIDDWNGDTATLVVGQHQATAHRYSSIQVVRFGPGGEIAPSDDASAPCGLVFASSSLDTELAAAALIQRPRGWLPLSDEDVPSDRLADLQLAAQDDYNAVIQVNGSIEAL